MKRGSFTFVLHCHLPYVINHGQWPHGTDWLYEAAVETYIPLLRELRAVTEEGIQPAVTLNITPVLMEQLAHPRFKEGLKTYLQEKIEAADFDLTHFTELKQPHLADLASLWVRFYSEIKESFAELGGDILAGFNELSQGRSGAKLEIMTSGATHGYFPLLGTDESIIAQVATGVRTFKKHMGYRPRGFWLPECAYRPAYEWSPPPGTVVHREGDHRLRLGIEEILFDNDLEYFIVDKHLIMGGMNQGIYVDRFSPLKSLWSNFSRGWNPPPEIENRSLLRPYLVSSTGTERAVAVFGRHEESALQVWSAEWGYPGNPAYLEFHKKHFPSGLKYWRVTGNDVNLGDKDFYEPDWVEAALEEQAEHYVDLIGRHLDDHRESSGETGMLTAPFDAELFGHWWFEGPKWLGKILRKLPEKGISPTTCGNYLDAHPPREVISLPEGSWGKGGFHYIWLNESTEWTWKEIYAREERFRELVDKWKGDIEPVMQRLLKQMARELLLLEASDWQFLISTWSAKDYAEDRVAVHAQRFDELDAILNTYQSEGMVSDYSLHNLSFLENEDSLFDEIDISKWGHTGRDEASS
ncbi:MAG: 1,4-alpha-glucan branching protein domain-containing protein [Candidatus Neomarinimicrobiota bacterium]